MVAFLSHGPIDPTALLGRVEAECMGAGAVASFTGLARGTGKDGSPIPALVLHSYRGVTLASIQAIVNEAKVRFELIHAHVSHRSGRILAGEAIVFVAAVAPHRAAALDGVAFIMDRLKTEAVFWKYEETPAGKCWIEPTDDDYARAQKWSP